MTIILNIQELLHLVAKYPEYAYGVEEILSINFHPGSRKSNDGMDFTAIDGSRIYFDLDSMGNVISLEIWAATWPEPE